MIPGIGNLCLMLSVFLLPLPLVWLKDIWSIFMRFFQGWLTNTLTEWLTICRNFLPWPYASWDNFFLCSGRHDFTDAQTIHVMSQIKDGENPVSLILAETLLGLDVVFHGGECQNFLGSPLALQKWLMEWLDMIARPTTGNYGHSSFLSRTVIKIECQTESDWVKFLNKKSNALVRWNCY